MAERNPGGEKHMKVAFPPFSRGLSTVSLDGLRRKRDYSGRVVYALEKHNTAAEKFTSGVKLISSCLLVQLSDLFWRSFNPRRKIKKQYEFAQGLFKRNP